jgi:hypothetical protein
MRRKEQTATHRIAQEGMIRDAWVVGGWRKIAIPLVDGETCSP